jgi:hypothetical protein
LGVGITAAVVAASLPNVKADPIWELGSETVGDPITPTFEDVEGTPLEPYAGMSLRQYTEQIKNTSTEGEELKKYTYPFGSDAGDIVHGWFGNDINNSQWSLTLNPSLTVLESMGYNVAPNNTALFKFVTLDTDPAGDYVDVAHGVSDPLDEPFQSDFGGGNFQDGLKVSGPGVIPEPGSLSLFALGALLTAYLRRAYANACTSR